MPKRLIGVLLLVLLGVVGMAGTSVAVEDEVSPEDAPPPPEYSEVCAEEAVGSEFCPDPYEQPTWFQWVIYPLLGVGLLMVLGLLFVYLVWQPRFARERQQKTRR